jgi:hypothetical protein
VQRLPSADVIPDRIAPQLATLVSSPPTGAGWVYEIKLDGYRILACIEGGNVRLFTRNGNDWTTKMLRLANDVAAFAVKNAWLDGEVVVLGDTGIPDFNALQNAFDGKNTDGLTYFVFDLLYLNSDDLRPLQFRQRRALLEELFHDYSGDVRLSQTFNVDGASMLESPTTSGVPARPGADPSIMRRYPAPRGPPSSSLASGVIIIPGADCVDPSATLAPAHCFGHHARRVAPLRDLVRVKGIPHLVSLQEREREQLFDGCCGQSLVLFDGERGRRCPDCDEMTTPAPPRAMTLPNSSRTSAIPYKSGRERS